MNLHLCPAVKLYLHGPFLNVGGTFVGAPNDP